MITDSSNNTIKTIKTIKTINFNDDCINSTLVLSTTPNRRQLSNLPECPANSVGLSEQVPYEGSHSVTLWNNGAYVVQHTEISAGRHATANTQTYLCTGRAKGGRGVHQAINRDCDATSPEASTQFHLWTPTGHHRECYFGCTACICMLRRKLSGSCSSGKFYFVENSQCKDCPFGQYQDQASQSTCKKCTTSNFDVTIGSNGVGTQKTITTSQHGNIVCPSIVNKDNILVGYQFNQPDTFTITVSGQIITALRTDGGPGWGVNLKFSCKTTTGGKSSIYC